MDMIMYYLLCLFARKKFILNISYFLGTIAFISLSYNTANKLYKSSGGIRVPISQSLINLSHILNESFCREERTQFLRNKCENKKDSSFQTLSNVIHRNNLLDHLGFILRSHSLFYCSVPKVATRTLLTYITYLHVRDELITSLTNNSSSYINIKSNFVDINYLNQMLRSSITNDSLSLLSMFLSRLMSTIKSNSSQLDLWLMYQKRALPYIRLRTLSNPSILFSPTFTRVIFVRHPLERLASAYMDKIASLKAEPLTLYDSIRRAICRKYSFSYLTPAERAAYHTNRLLVRRVDEPCGKVIPTFEHFVDYIMNDASQTDVHWQPYTVLCDACTFKYNFIGKYETMQDDINLLRSQFGLNSTDWDVNYNYFSTGKTKENYKLLYSKLPKHLICNLKHFYQDDFKLFDYRFEDYLIDRQNIYCPTQFYRRYPAVV